MNNKMKIILWILLIIIIISIFMTYRRSYVSNNYEIISVEESILE